MQTQGADRNPLVVPRRPHRLTFAPSSQGDAAVAPDAECKRACTRPSEQAVESSSAPSRPPAGGAHHRAAAALLSPVGLLVGAFVLIALIALARPAPGDLDRLSSGAPPPPPPVTMAAAGAAELPASVPAATDANAAGPLLEPEHAAARATPSEDVLPGDRSERSGNLPDGGQVVAPAATDAPTTAARVLPPATADDMQAAPAPAARSRPRAQAQAGSASRLPGSARASSGRVSTGVAASGSHRALPPGAERVRLSACGGVRGLRQAQCRQCAELGPIARGFCSERVRLAWCANRWGRSADCPMHAVTTPN